MWSVVTALIKKEYPLVYHNLDDFQWSQYMQPLTEQIKLKIRENMLTLIPKVYTSIELTQVSNYFGMTDILPGIFFFFFKKKILRTRKILTCDIFRIN